MLNISPQSIKEEVVDSHFGSLRLIKTRTSGTLLLKILIALSLIFFLFFFLPWTQNIRAKGNVTTLKPDQRPQTIHSVIAGRVEDWYVQEGDLVEKGDTILFISEIKDAYFDPQLLSRTQSQVKAKELSVLSYMEKVKSLDNRIDALAQTGKLKLEQTQNKLMQAKLKVESDSLELEAAILNFDISEKRFARQEQLYEQGLKSLTDLESRKMELQKTKTALISKKNDLLASRNQVLNAYVEITSIQAQYKDDISKAESEKFTAMSNMYDAETVVTKLQNQYMNYSVRTGMYYITAPQKGYVTHALTVGIGETIKEGDEIVSIMPADYDLAIAMFVKPIDLPLISKGQTVRIQFDGWPAIVFSGWPNTSYGTYGGVVFAIDNFISDNGMYRVLVQPDPNDNLWPDAIRVGAGTKNMLLLKDVPIWYELWRQINGFPPDYYTTKALSKKDSKKEK